MANFLSLRQKIMNKIEEKEHQSRHLADEVRILQAEIRVIQEILDDLQEVKQVEDKE